MANRPPCGDLDSLKKLASRPCGDDPNGLKKWPTGQGFGHALSLSKGHRTPTTQKQTLLTDK
jgi:hypothetical protein